MVNNTPIGAPLPFGVYVTDHVPVDPRYWAGLEAELNNGYTHAGMFRFIPEGSEKDRLYIKLSTGWHRLPLFSQKGDAGTLEIVEVKTGDTAGVRDLSDDPSKARLSITLPRGLDGRAATLSISKVTSVDSTQPAKFIEKGTPEARVYELEIPKGQPGAKGEKGEAFKIDFIGTFAQRNNYDGVEYGEGTSYFVADEGNEEVNGYLYFKLPNNTWSDGVPFTGLRGWTPFIGTVTVSPGVTVLAVKDWIGGQGLKPELPEAGYYIGPNGYTLNAAEAFNITGPAGAKGDAGRAFIIDAQGNLSGRDTHNGATYPFVYYDNVAGNVYFRLPNNTWSDAFKIKGEKGQAGNTGWLAFAESAAGLNPSKEPAGKTYVSVHYALTYPADFTPFTSWQQLGTVVNQTTNGSGVTDHEELNGRDIATSTTNIDVSDETKAWHLSSAFLADVFDAAYPPAPPTVAINVTPAGPLEFNAVNTSFLIDVAATKSHQLATLATSLIEVSRNGGSTWTTILNVTGIASDNYTLTDHPYTGNSGSINNNNYIFRVTVTDTRGNVGTSSQTVLFKTYAAPTTNLVVNPTATQELGQDDFIVSGSSAQQSSLVPVTRISIEKSENGGAWSEVAASVTGTISNTAVLVTPGTTSVRFRLKAVDSQQSTYSDIVTVPFLPKFYYGFNVKPMLDFADVLALSGFLADDFTQDFTLPANSSLRYIWIVATASVYPTVVRDLTNSNTDYPVSADGGNGDYYRMGSVSGNNSQGFPVIYYLLRSKNATSGYGGTNLRTL